jgi:lipopolysaccharide export system protein LptA
MGKIVSIERLRVWLLVGAGLLVMVVASFLWYAHYRAHRFIKDLPGKLGIDISQETNAFTYSQTVQGRTIFTIHAAKAVQRKDGIVTLHDVGIVLYGRKQDRADRIYGKEFEYDQKAGVIRAAGEVHIDLQAPAATDAHGKSEYAAGKDLHGEGAVEKGSEDNRLIHVKTSGLVFMRELGVAATDQDVEFEFNGMNGFARGADYSSDTGILVLHSAVKMNGLHDGRPMVLTASRAEMDRTNNRVTLAQAKYVSVGAGQSGATQTAAAQRAVVHLRSDGGVEGLDAEGEVTLEQGDGGRVVAQRANVAVSADGRAQAARLYDGVRYTMDGPLQQANGVSTEGQASFDKKGRPEQVVLTGAVHFNERVRAPGAETNPWSERELGADRLELALGADGAGKAQLRDAKASGSARLKVVDAPRDKKGPVSSVLAGDVLTAHFVQANGATRITEAHGVGHTALRRVSETGAEDTSSGETMDVRFRMAAAEKSGAGQGAEEIATAVQQGNVVMTHTPVRKPGDAGAPTEQRATAQKAVYDGTTKWMTLTGGVQVNDEAGSVLWADKVAMEQGSGDGVAEGSVKASYQQPKAGQGQGDVVHVLAARAELKRAEDQAIFYGGAGRPARLWQGGSQVEAPVLQFEQRQRRLVARGEGQGSPMAVHTVLVGRGSGKAGAAKAGAGNGGAVRVASRELIYSDESRKAEFSGGVEVENAAGRMRGQDAIAYLQAAAGGNKPVAAVGTAEVKTAGVPGGFMGGSVERIVVTGQVEMEQPGRRATGEQLVYTASDGLFVLTGTAAAPPKIMDETRGMVTGASLRFHSGDESVVISNGENAGAGQRVRTETRVKKN